MLTVCNYRYNYSYTAGTFKNVTTGASKGLGPVYATGISGSWVYCKNYSLPSTCVFDGTSHPHGLGITHAPACLEGPCAHRRVCSTVRATFTTPLYVHASTFRRPLSTYCPCQYARPRPPLCTRQHI